MLLYEFKGDIAELPLGLRHTRHATWPISSRSTAALPEGDESTSARRSSRPGNELSGDLSDREYREARAVCLQGKAALDGALQQHNLDAVLSPSFSFGTSGPAVAGYPLMSVPVGISAEGRPAGVWLSGGFLSEPTLISLAYAIEQLIDARVPPEFEGTAPPPPPNAGICAALDAADSSTAGLAKEARQRHAAARRGGAGYRPTF